MYIYITSMESIPPPLKLQHVTRNAVNKRYYVGILLLPVRPSFIHGMANG